MNRIALDLYVVALLADLGGAWLAMVDLKSRVELLTNFRHEVAGDLPMTYNLHPDVLQLFADQEPTMVAARLRDGLNEMIGALDKERRAREATEASLAKLSGVGANLGRLRLAVALLVVGVVLGGAGNIVSSVLGDSPSHCLLTQQQMRDLPTRAISIRCNH